MQRNVGENDQAARLIVGILLLSLVLLRTSEWHWLGLLGLIPFATGVARICPLYAVIGVNTCEKETQNVQKHPDSH